MSRRPSQVPAPSSPPLPEEAIVRNDTRPVSDRARAGAPVPCPACGDVRFELAPRGSGRRCWACDHTWIPGGRVTERPEGQRAGAFLREGGRESGATEGQPSALPSDPRAAALVPLGLLTCAGRRVSVDVADAPRVLETAARLGIRQVWIGPEQAARLKIPARFTVPKARRADAYRYGVAHVWSDAAGAAGWVSSSDPPGLAPWVGFRRGDQWVDVVLPSWSPDNPFAGATNAAVLLGALQDYAELLGLRYRRSPGTTGIALMRAVHSGRRAVQLEEAPTLPHPAGKIDSEAPGSWLSPEIEGAGAWLHAWDVNAMYLAACSSAELGFGEPEHIDRRRISSVLHWRPGYWLAAIDALPSRFPRPFVVDGRPRWYTTPALQWAAELALQVDIREGWVYPEQHRWLEPWYACLRDARRALMASDEPARRLALGAVKATYTRALGRLAGGWLQAGDETFRPDWRETVVDRARANMHRHLVRVENITGRVPVALNADAVVYASVHRDPDEAAAELGLQVSEQLGKWKHAGGPLPASEAAALVGAHPTGGAALRPLLSALGVSE